MWEEGSLDQAHGAEDAQSAWANSVDSLCAFDASSTSLSGRQACLLREMGRRARDLAEQLSGLGQ